jgi:hypothetical protein
MWGSGRIREIGGAEVTVVAAVVDVVVVAVVATLVLWFLPKFRVDHKRSNKKKKKRS